MTELHRDGFVSGHFFVAIAGLAAMREILRRPSAGLPRIEEIKAIAAAWDEFPNNIPVELIEHDVEAGYTAWAPTYDGPNPAITTEEAEMQRLMAAVPIGQALDAGCGTGRHAGYLVSLGHDVIGVDATPAMLDVARANHPEVDLRSGRFEDLPVDAGSIDLIVSSLAVCHAPDLDAVFGEFARVTRPGATVLVSDPHPVTVMLGGAAGFRGDGDPAEGMVIPWVENRLHPMHTYVNAAVGAGFDVVECLEPTFHEVAFESNPASAIYPDAVRQAYDGVPMIVIWRFVRR